MVKDIKYNNSEKAVIYGISLLIGIVASVVMLLLFALIVFAADLPETVASPFSALCIGIGSAVSGFISSQKIKSGGLINGFICGMAFYALIFLLSLFISENGFSLLSLYRAVIVIISAMIGGVVGVNTVKNIRF